MTWDAYDSQGTDTKVIGADLTRQFGRRTEASAGTYYGIYKYDLLLNQERENVRVRRAHHMRNPKRTLSASAHSRGSLISAFTSHQKWMMAVTAAR